MRPLVGIAPGLDDRGRWKRGRETFALDAAYTAALDEAGASAVLLPAQSDAGALLARVDGLLVPGGGDFVPPLPYPPAVAFDPVPARQLAFDRRLLEGALAAGLPVLGVCYGMQLLAVARGGTLHYDLATDRPDARDHQLAGPDARHALSVESDTRLAAILGVDAAPVNSRHHQAVATPGTGLRVCARAPDGVVEAIEGEGEGFCLGVQWHPETLEAAHRRALFGAFVAACRSAC